MYMYIVHVHLLQQTGALFIYLYMCKLITLMYSYGNILIIVNLFQYTKELT